jgi:hypothetical protein
MLQPHHGRGLDPACGSGGMFVQADKFVAARATTLLAVSRPYTDQSAGSGSKLIKRAGLRPACSVCVLAPLRAAPRLRRSRARWLSTRTELRSTTAMATSPPYLDDLTQFVQENLDSPAALTVGLAALLVDPAAYQSAKTSPRNIVQHVEELVLTNRDIAGYLETGNAPAVRQQHDGHWIVAWRNAFIPSDVPHRNYDLCISFAGPDREIARAIARELLGNGMNRKVFYDEFERVKLWGTELFSQLHDIYSNQCKFCVILFSHAYRQRAWTKHELRAAQTRTLSERGPYILPVEIDAGAVPEEFSTTSYWPYKSGDETLIAEAIEQRINDFLGDYYLTAEEIAEALDRDAVVSAILTGFREGIKQRRTRDDVDGVWVTTILALIAICETARLTPAARAVLNLIGFSPGLVADAFDADDQLLIFDTHLVRRTLHNPEFFEFSPNWQAYISTHMPSWWQNIQEYDDDEEVENGGAQDRQAKPDG